MGATVVNWKLKSKADWILAIGGAAVVLWTFWPIDHQIHSLDVRPKVIVDTAEAEDGKQWNENDFREALSKKLRRSVPVDKVKVRAPDPVEKAIIQLPQIDPPKIELIATMIGKGEASAVVRGKQRKVLQVHIGDHVMGAVITAIRPGEMEVEYEGITAIFSIPRRVDERGDGAGG